MDVSHTTKLQSEMTDQTRILLNGYNLAPAKRQPARYQAGPCAKLIHHVAGFNTRSIEQPVHEA